MLLKMKRLIPFSIFLILTIFVVFFINKNSHKNWQFYTKETIGVNSKLHIYDNLVFDEDSIVFNSQNGKTFSIDRNSGQLNWEFQAQFYSPHPPTIFEEKLYLANFDGNIYSLNKNTGYKIWQFNIPGQFQPDTPIINSPKNELVFFGSRDGFLYALNSNTGEMIWSKKFQEIDTSKVFVLNTIHFGSIYVDEDQIYVLNAPEKRFYAIDQISGEVNWQIDNISFIFEAPLFLDQFIILKQEKNLLSIDKKSGLYKKIDKLDTSADNLDFFKIKNDEDYILILDGRILTKITPDLEKIEWQVNSIGGLLHWKKRINVKEVEIKNGKILTQKYLKLENGNHLVAVDYKEGKALWDTLISASVNCQYYSSEDAFIGLSNGDIISVNPDSGTINWQKKSDGGIAEIFFIKNNILTVNHKAGDKIAFNYLDRDGNEIWQYVPDKNYISDDIYEDNGNIYLILDDFKKIIEKININDTDPDQKLMKKINFLYEEVEEVKDRGWPFLEMKDHTPFSWKVKNKFLEIRYLISYFKNIFIFEKDEKISNNVFEITIKNDENLYSNKFTDLKIEATFKQKNENKKIKTKGFYYDNNTWKVRFIAPKTDDYDYQVKIKSPYFSKKIKGNIYLEKGNPEKLTVSGNLFTINNKNIFFPIGIQPTFLDRNYNGSLIEELPDSSSTEPVQDLKNYSFLKLDEFLNTYKNEAGMNVFRYGPDNWAPALLKSSNIENIIFDINGGKFGDILLTKLKEKNFKIIMTIFGFHPPYITKEEITKKENQEALKAYLNYVIARFSPYVDMWELSNEAEANYKWYEIVIDYLKNNDPYQHPISTNWETSSAKQTDFLSIHWYNTDKNDPGFLSGEINYLNNKYSNPNQPILISEFGFKNYSYFEGSAESIRIMSWLSAFQQMGIIFWNQGQNGIFENPNNANVYLGPIERSYLLSLNNFLTQDLSLPLETEVVIIPGLEAQGYFLKNKDTTLAYFLKTNKNREEKAYININFQKDALFQWIDPKTNEVIEEKMFKEGRFDILIPHFEVDLAMKIVYLD